MVVFKGKGGRTGAWEKDQSSKIPMQISTSPRHLAGKGASKHKSLPWFKSKRSLPYSEIKTKLHRVSKAPLTHPMTPLPNPPDTHMHTPPIQAHRPAHLENRLQVNFENVSLG